MTDGTIATRRSVPDPALVTELTKRIVREHRVKLATLQRAMFTDAAEFHDGPARIPPGFAVTAVNQKSARVTVCVTLSSVAELLGTQDEGLRVVDVSVAAHHTKIDRRVELSGEEQEAWARAALGQQWEHHAYYQGHLVANDGTLLACHYLLFLSGDNAPTAAPSYWTGPLRRLTAASSSATN